jgi:hypothetical protein
LFGFLVGDDAVNAPGQFLAKRLDVLRRLVVGRLRRRRAGRASRSSMSRICRLTVRQARAVTETR